MHVYNNCVAEISGGDYFQYMSKTDVEERLSNGHRLFGRLLDNEIAAYAWVASPGCRVSLLFDVRFPVPERSAYIWDVFTSRAYRRQGYASELHHGISYLVQDVCTVFCAVDRNNKPSISQIEKMGYSPVFRYFALRVVGRTVLAYANSGDGMIPLQKFLKEFRRTN